MRDARHARRRPPAPAPDRRRRRWSRRRPRGRCFYGAVRRPRLGRRDRVAARPRRGADDVRRRAARAGARAAAGARARRARSSASRASPAGSRARTPIRQPQRTAVTASALMIGLALVVFVDDLRRRPARDDRQGRSTTRSSAAGDRHAPGRLLAAARTASSTQLAQGRRRRRPSRRCASRPASSRGDDKNQRRHRHRSGDGRPGAQARVGRAAPRRRWRARRDDQALVEPDWADGHNFKVGDSIALSRRAGKRSTYEIAGTYDTRSGLIGDVIAHQRVARARLGRPRTSRSRWSPATPGADAERARSRRPTTGAEAVPDRRAADDRRVQGRAAQAGQPAARARLRAARRCR